MTDSYYPESLVRRTNSPLVYYVRRWWCYLFCKAVAWNNVNRFTLCLKHGLNKLEKTTNETES